MPKEIEPLSEIKIQAAKTKEKSWRLFDGGGLFLLITPDGSKRWRYKYRFDGKEKLLSFGIYPEVSLAEARSSKDAARALLVQGIDPSIVRKQEKVRKKAQRLEANRLPSVRVTIDGNFEIWKGNNTMYLTLDEARFIANTLKKIVR